MTTEAGAADGVALPEAAGANRWLIAIAVMMSTFMEVLDTTVVNVSLPHVAGSLSASTDEATWALTSYLVANAIVLPMTGWLAGLLGRKRLLLLSVSGFTVSSFLCGFAPSLPFLIAMRVVQGATGGGLQPLSQAILLETFPPRERGRAMAFWSLGIIVAPMLGPVLGGWLTDNFSWRWVFYINIPIGIAALLMTQFFVEDPSYLRRADRRIDYWGLGFLVVGIGSLQIMLDKGQQEDWFASRFITVLFVLTVTGIGALIARELMTRSPVIDLTVFRDRTYAAGVFLITVLGFVLYGSIVLLPLLMQTLLGYSSFDAGVTTLPRGVTSFFISPMIGLLIARVSPRRMLAVGICSASASLFLLAHLSLSAGFQEFLWAQVLQGAGMSCIFIPLTTITNDAIPREKMGNATSIFNLMRNIGGSVGIAAVTTMLARRTQVHTNILGAHVDPFRPEAAEMFERLRQALIAAGSDPATATQQARGALFGMVQRQAAMLSYNEIFLALGVLFACMLPLLLLMRKPAHLREGAGVGGH